jgi:two-component system response regulator (stage 0 sporulation protein A)
MEKKISKIVVVDGNENFSQRVKDYFLESRSDVRVASTFNNVIDAIDYISDNHVDIVITDLIIPNADGFDLISEIKRLGLEHMPKIIVVTALTGEGFIQKAFSMGVSYYMLKPVNFELLESRILDILKDEFINAPINSSVVSNNTTVFARPKTKQLDERITNIFITVGIPAHIKGYQFLREAIKMAIDTPDIINSITKKLYPSIADKFDTSASKVERAIRHAIEVAWNRGKIENINNLFGIRVYGNNEKPTNGEFIALVADKMLIEGA